MPFEPSASDPAQFTVRQAMAVLRRARAALSAKREIAFLARTFSDAAQARARLARDRFERRRRP